jgi:beta-N-acetylhexosaminidase
MNRLKKNSIVAALSVLLLSTAAFSSNGSATPVSKYAARAAEIADSMDIKLLAAQLILSAVDGKSTVPEKTHKLLTEIPIGGVALFGYNIAPDSEKNRAFVKELSKYLSDKTLPPFVAIDQEGGIVQRIRGKAALPPPLSYWEKVQAGQNAEAAIAAIEQDAAKAGQELRHIGVTLNFAPLAEVLTKENQPFLKTRAYGSDSVYVTNAAAAFLRGMEKAKIASTLKHFPGNSGIDPHHNKVVLNISNAELETYIWPFKELIRREAPALIMVSHAIVPSWDTIPLTRSPVAVKHIRDMGFTGIIMADCFAMVAAGAPPEIAVVEALAAGVDMIFTWPNDLPKLYKAIIKAIENGTLSEARIRESAKRVIYQKIRYGVVE